MRRFIPVALLLLTACDCGSGPGGGGDGDGGVVLDDDVTGIRISPEAVTLTIDGVTSGQQAFTVETIAPTPEDVTAGATFELSDRMVGRMDGATFISGLAGGETMVTARVGSFSASAVVTVVVEQVIEVQPPGTPMLPSNPGDVFSGTTDDAGRAPTLVYPNDGVIFPPNLGRVEIHFLPGDGNDLFEIRFAANGLDVLVYTRCESLGRGCLYTTSPDVWTLLSNTARGVAPIEITVRGTSEGDDTSGTSATFAMNIAPVDVIGGIYYWTTSNGTSIMRVDFGDPDQTPERFYPFSGGGCYGCHAVSRNGRRMTLSQNGQNDGRFTVIDVEARAELTPISDDRREQFQSWNPDSNQFAAIYGDGNPPDTNIRIRDGNNGDVIESIPLGHEPTHPDWSPRGDRIAYTKVTRHQTSQRPGRGGISYVEALNGGGWSAPIDLVPEADGFNRYYPAYAPDAQFLVYCESICPNGEIYDGSCDADADEIAKLWAVPADGGTPIRLDRVNAPGVRDEGNEDLSNTFPKWAPFVDAKNRDGSGRLMWFTFSSRRQYGLRSPSGSNQLLWMTALDPDAILAGEDGSYPAFALPFQDLDTSNHIAQWTTRIVPPSDGGIDPGNPGDGGPMCKQIGDRCEPAQNECCAGLTCVENGPGTFVCRPDV